jgi:hypothetical protein
MVIEFVTLGAGGTIRRRNWPVVPRVDEWVTLPDPDGEEIAGLVKKVGYISCFCEDIINEQDPINVRVVLEL